MFSILEGSMCKKPTKSRAYLFMCLSLSLNENYRTRECLSLIELLVYVWEAHENKVLIPNLRMHFMPIFELNVSTFSLKKATMVHEVDPL
jgi:hypothetical protein